MKLIPLTQGYFAKVDNEDFEKLSVYKWHVKINHKLRDDIRAYRINKYNCTIGMTGDIMEVPVGMVVDHINHDTLDNRKKNLRICSRSQNQWNCRLKKTNTSGYKGVSWSKRDKIWRAQIGINGKTTYLGSFDTPEKAALVYNKEAKKLFGEYCLLNKIKTT